MKINTPMFCLEIHPAAEGGFLCAVPALACLGGAAELLLATTLDELPDAIGTVVGCADEMDTALLEPEGSKIVTIPDEGSV